MTKNVEMIIRKAMAAMLCIAMLCACSKDDEDATIAVKSLKAGAGYTVLIHGTGTATIDWGDGSAPQTVTLSEPADLDNVWNAEYEYEPPYTDFARLYDVTITGDNVTGIIFEGFDITAIDVSKMPTLKYLVCYSNNLTELDVSKNTALVWLDCGNNSLSALDVSKNTALVQLDCSYNSISSLDLSKNTALELLDCYNNSISTLNISANTALKEFYCNFNNFSAAALDEMFEALPDRNGKDAGEIYISNNPGAPSEGGAADITIAQLKNWNVTD